MRKLLITMTITNLECVTLKGKIVIYTKAFVKCYN